jgi:hypothetical protein
MTMQEAFDPGDPFDAMADQFRVRIADMALDAFKIAIYRELAPSRQLECVMAGVMTGLIGVCFASIEPGGRDAMMEAIADYLPHARSNAEGIIDSGADAEIAGENK